MITVICSQVVDYYGFDEIAEVNTIKASSIQIVLRTGGRIVLSSNKAGAIRDLVDQFIVEARSEQFEYARVLADFTSREENALNLAAGDIVAVLPKDDEYTQKGWLYGIKNGKYGLFPADYVDKMSPKSIRKEIKTISRITESAQRGRHSSGLSGDSPVEDLQSVHSPIDDEEDFNWNSRHNRGDSYDAGDNSDVSISAGKVANDGKHPLLEFAMSYFREIDVINNDDGGKKKKKKKNSKSDWTWKEQVELVKWQGHMIDNSLMRMEHPELNKIALECFASIMRFMGDLPLLKNQMDVDCALLVLSFCHKHEEIKDEVFCQIMKQTTNNKSEVPESAQKGWRLFSILAAYFTCSDNLKPFLFKYLETAAYDKRRAYHGTALVCLHNLRKTFKFGGRKNAPSVEEVTAITAGRNSKRQIYR